MRFTGYQSLLGKPDKTGRTGMGKFGPNSFTESSLCCFENEKDRLRSRR